MAVYFGQRLALRRVTRRILPRTVRASWADGESNHREQGGPVGMATLMILFHKAEVLPRRCMNPGKGLFQKRMSALEKKQNTGAEEEAEKRQRGERPVLFGHAAVFFRTLWAPSARQVM